MKLLLDPDRRMMRQFAITSLIVFPAIAGYLAWRHDLPTVWVLVLCAVGVVIAFVEFVLHKVLGGLLERLIPRAAFQLLSLIAFPIGFVLAHVLMAAIYYLVITPMGLVMRLLGRDVIGRRLEPQRTSYWHDRGTPRRASSYFELY